MKWDEFPGSHVMSSYWANFVTHGDPNGKGVAHWQPVGNEPEVMGVGNDFKQVQVAGHYAGAFIPGTL